MKLMKNRNLREWPVRDIPQEILGMLTEYAFASRKVVTAIFFTVASFILTLTLRVHDNVFAVLTVVGAVSWMWTGRRVAEMRATILNTLTLHPSAQTWPVAVLSNTGPPFVLAMMAAGWTLYWFMHGA